VEIAHLVHGLHDLEMGLLEGIGQFLGISPEVTQEVLDMLFKDGLFLLNVAEDVADVLGLELCATAHKKNL